MSSTPDGGGTITTPSATANEAPVENYSDQGTSVTDISGDDISTQRMIIEFSDEAVEVVGRHIKKAESERRI